MYLYIRMMLCVLLYAFTMTTARAEATTLKTWPKVLYDQKTTWRYRIEKLPNLQALYAVRNDGMLELDLGEIRREHMIIWNDLRMLVEGPMHEYFSWFAVYREEPRSGDNAMAFVFDTFGDIRSVAVNIFWFGNEQTRDLTLLHEFGHIILSASLEMRQLIEECNDEVALGSKPLVERFRRAFWSHCGPKIRINHITSHASKNIAEDLADTWVSFVVCDEPVSSVRLTAEKVRFMWREKELLNRRKYIHKSLGHERMNNLREEAGDYYCSF